MKDFDPTKVEFPDFPKDLIYIKCKDEATLLSKFLICWQQFDLDVISGWNIDGYDLPYLFNRITRVHGEEVAKKLSPWGLVECKTVNDKWGKDRTEIVLDGIIVYDYLKLYRKFIPTQQEQYTLEYIAQETIGVGKLDYSEYANLAELYEKNPEKFYSYNCLDVDRVVQIDDKLKLIDLALTIVYDARCLPKDIFGSVAMWDTIIHNYLLEKKIVVPPAKHKTKKEQFEGAYVKIPVPGKYRWIASFDFAGLYPSLAVWGNFSPETYKGKIPEIMELADFVQKKLPSKIKDHLLDNNLALAANMTVWDKDREGIIPQIFKKVLADRKVYKNKMFEHQRAYEKNKNKDDEYAITRYDRLQQAKKIQINSAYGCIGNAHFRFYDTDFAEAITLSGRLAFHWGEYHINKFLNELFKMFSM